MEVIPSIDLKGGRCVRLYQGDYARETVFSEDPLGTAQRWESLGAPRLHLVDLDGAASGELCHMQVISEIVKALTIPVQVGGGIRHIDVMWQLLQIGVQRVILGTAAVENPALVEEACKRFSDSIIVSIDAQSRDVGTVSLPISGHVATSGWQNMTTTLAIDMIDAMARRGTRRFIYTDIRRDGTLTQPNFEAIAELINRTKLPIIASGGVTSIDHLKRLSQLGVEGAIIGRALYTGDISLDKALAALEKETSDSRNRAIKDGGSC
jgi:phosphoribosylformimino-5-aminoimidazole carboxamide ribotide isomerase